MASNRDAGWQSLLLGRTARISPLRAVFAFAFLGLSLATAQGQEASDAPATLQEVKVTARRVTENLMTVPVSLNVLSAKNIQDRNLKDMTEISLFAPSFRFVNQPGGESPTNDRNTVAVDFRGLVESGGSGSVFVDGAPVVNGIYPTLDQIQRVEVLKGPQSAYFGRSTFAGAINYITLDPNLTELSGTVRGEASSYSSNDDSVEVNMPVIHDALGIIVTARHQVKGGEYTNADDLDQSLGAETTDSASVIILFKPNDKLKMKGWFSWMADDDGPGAEAGINGTDGLFNSPSSPGATFQGGYYKGPLPNAGQLNRAIISCSCTMTPFLQNILVNNSPGNVLIFNPDWSNHFGLQRRALQGDIRVDFEFLPGYTLSSLTAMHYDKQGDRWDIDNRAGDNVANPFYGAIPNTLPYYEFDLTNLTLNRDWSEELRVVSPQDRMFTWSFGADYLHNFTPGSSLFGEIPVGPANFGSITPATTETPAIFGGVGIKLMPKLTLSLEARYQWDKLTAETFYNGNNPTTGIARQALNGTFTSFSPRMSLSYQYASNSSAYALFSRGYKPGGFNTAVLFDSPGQLAFIAAHGGNEALTYAQERLDNYEFGIKSTFLNGRARTLVSFYYDKWVDGQVPAQIDVPANPLLPPGGSNPTHEESPITNAGLIDLKGIEFEGDILLTEHLVFNSSFAINDTDVVSYKTCSDCLEILGTDAAHGHVPGAPKYKGSLAGTYTDHLLGDWDWHGRIDYVYSGSQYADWSNVTWTQPSQLIDVFVGISTAKIRLEGFVKNLTNNSAPLSVTHQVNAFTFFSVNQNTWDYALPDKRTFGIRASYNF